MILCELYEANCRDWDAAISSLSDGLPQDPRFLRLRGFCQHADVSTYRHSLAVARLCFWISLHLGKGKLDRRALIRSAILHDYFLYDWHEPGHPSWHGFRHPRIAAQNAQRDFGLDSGERKTIVCHMWPLTILAVPHTREAWILTIADKICSIWEIAAHPKTDNPVLAYTR